MALSFESLYENYQTHTADTGAANTALGKARINDTYKELIAMHDWYFARTTKAFTVGASDYQYDLPYNYGRMVAVTIRNGDTVYSLKEVPSHDAWQRLHAFRNTSTSDIPESYHITADSLEIYPVPASTGTADYGTMYYIKRVPDMAADDYTTGTVTFTASSTTLTGSGTTWTATMVGRFIKAPDGLWYEISAFVSTTALTLKKAYGGSTASGQTYTIGELPSIPEDFHTLLYYQPVAIFWMQKKETDMAAYWQALYDKGVAKFKDLYDRATSGQIIQPQMERRRSIPDAIGGISWDDSGVQWNDPSVFWDD